MRALSLSKKNLLTTVKYHDRVNECVKWWAYKYKYRALNDKNKNHWTKQQISKGKKIERIYVKSKVSVKRAIIIEKQFANRIHSWQGYKVYTVDSEASRIVC